MKIVSWNIACLPKFFDTMGNINYRLNKIKLILEQCNADIVLLQEVFSDYSREILTTFFKKYKYNIVISPKSYVFFNGGLLIASKHKIVHNDCYTYNNSVGDDWWATKGILYAQVIINNKIYNIFNTHCNNDNPILCYNRENVPIIKNKQTCEFLNYIINIKNNINKNFINNKYKLSNITYHKNNIIYIIAGDFNMLYKSELYNKFINKLEKIFNINTNKNTLITDAHNNTQIDYIINCYDKDVLDIPTSETYIIDNIENNRISDHNILVKKFKV
jgi:hypothetical protein